MATRSASLHTVGQSPSQWKRAFITANIYPRRQTSVSFYRRVIITRPTTAKWQNFVTSGPISIIFHWKDLQRKLELKLSPAIKSGAALLCENVTSTYIHISENNMLHVSQAASVSWVFICLFIYYSWYCGASLAGWSEQLAGSNIKHRLHSNNSNVTD